MLIGEFLVNGELLVGDNALPLVSVLGQQVGNMLEIVLGTVLLRRMIGSRAALTRTEEVGGMVLAVSAATAVSATFGAASMLAGGVIHQSEVPTFWRTWWLGDSAGALVVVPLALAWARNPSRAWRRICTWEGGLLIASVIGFCVMAISFDEPVTYIVFPSLIWAAFRFGPPGGTLSVTIAAGVVVGFTANELGPYFKQAIDHRALNTQVYIVVAALTTLFLAAVVSEREQSAKQLAEAERREGERAVEERHRIARDLHDSVSQTLFSSLLHTRAAERALDQEGLNPSGVLGRSLGTIAGLTKVAQGEMRALIFQLSRDAVDDGLVVALTKHASVLGTREALPIAVRGPEGRLTISPRVETQLFAIAREALANVVKHADASKAWVVVESQPGRVLVEIGDDGRGFDASASHPGHFGLESMHSRAEELGGLLTIASGRRQGSLVRVEAPADEAGVSHGA